MDYIEIDQELANMETGTAAVDPARLVEVIEDIETLLAEYAQAVGQLGAVAPSKHAIKAWHDLLRRARALQQ